MHCAQKLRGPSTDWYKRVLGRPHMPLASIATSLHKHLKEATRSKLWSKPRKEINFIACKKSGLTQNS